MKEVFLCHASEDKQAVINPLTSAFSSAGISYWVDQAEIKWGDSLIDKVNEGLRDSRYVIVVLSKNFISKSWPQRELNSALNLESSSGEIIVLPLLIGSKSEIELIMQKYPLLNDKLYLVWQNDTTPIIQALQKILNKAVRADYESIKDEFKIDIPVIKKSYTQRDKDLFLRNSFDVVKSYFQLGLGKLREHYPEVETDFVDISNFKFLCKIYINGEIGSECIIWLGGMTGTNSIAYREGRNLEFNNDGSLNDWASVETDDYDIYLSFSNMNPMFQENAIQKANPEEAAEHFWKRFTSNL